MYNSKNFFFRLDGSNQIGYGHFYRCSVLAEEILKRSGNVVFLTREIDLEFINLIKDFKFKVITLPKVNSCEIESDLGLTNDLLSDAIWTADISKDGILVCDNYSFGENYYNYVRKKVKGLVVIDDHSNKKYPVDVFINQNFKAETLNYDVLSHTKLLLGAKYSLIRSKFLTLKPGTFGDYICVCFGASDPLNYTEKICDLIMDLDIQVIAVFGKGYRNFDGIRDKYLKNNKIKTIYNPSNIEEIFASCRCAIVGAGGVVWEFSYLKKPIAVLKTAENQEIMIEHLLKKQAIKYLNDKEDWKREIFNLYSDYEIQACLSDNIGGIIDGKGAKRIVDTMFEIFFNKEAVDDE